jgi:hypothetical protein
MSGRRTRTIVATVAVALGASGVVSAVAGCGSGGTSGTSGATTTAATKTNAATRPVKPESSVLKAAFRTYPRAPASQQVAPTVSPHAGKTSTIFTLGLTVRHALGAHGSGQYDYRVFLVGPRPRCASFTLDYAGRPGVRVPVKLEPPTTLGWCIGTIRGTVLLETNPNCPPPPATGRKRPCPSFATRFSDVGHFKFVTS